jgi:hypothetical protein
MTMCKTSCESVCDLNGPDLKSDLNEPRLSNSNLSDWVKNAAAEVLRRVIAKNEGACPKDMEEWRRCCSNYDISACGLRRGSTFTALLVGTRGGAWWIFYNECAPLSRQMRYIAHELAEYITRDESWHIDPPPGCETFSEFQVHHLIASEFEQLACEIG